MGNLPVLGPPIGSIRSTTVRRLGSWAEASSAEWGCFEIAHHIFVTDGGDMPRMCSVAMICRG